MACQTRKFSMRFQLLLFIITLSTLAYSYRLLDYNGVAAHWPWPQSIVAFRINDADLLDTHPWLSSLGVRNAVEAALDTWTSVSPSSITLNYDGTTTNKHSITDGQNVIFWKKVTSGGIRGFTFLHYPTGEILDADIEMDAWTIANPSWIWSLDSLLIDFYSHEVLDVQSIVTHELGHSLGISHTDLGGPSNGCPTMMTWAGWQGACKDEMESPNQNHPELEMRSLASDDENAVNFVYTPITLSWTNQNNHPLMSWSSQRNPYQWKLYRNLDDCGPECGTYFLIATLDAETTSYLDTGVTICSGKFCPKAYYYVRAVDTSGVQSKRSNMTNVPMLLQKKQADEEDISEPSIFLLLPNFPNPFNPVTTIKYDLPENSFVTMKVYDLMGHEVITLVKERTEAGFQSVFWDGKDSYGNPVSSGMYLYRLNAISRESEQEFHMTRKMVLLR